jgi:hypothetical protein
MLPNWLVPGLHLMDRSERTIKHALPYPTVLKWGQSSSALTVVQKPPAGLEWVFETAQAPAIDILLCVGMK